MCGRYELGLDSMDIQEYLKVIKDIQSIITPTGVVEAFPSQALPVLTERGFKTYRWGYPLQKKLLINARGESLEEKRLFQGPFLHERIIIPARAYFEWNKDRVKYRISGQEALNMAGLHLHQGEEHYFVVITTDANAQVQRIHHRMPLLLAKESLSDWLYDEQASRRLITPYVKTLELQALTPEQLHIFEM